MTPDDIMMGDESYLAVIAEIVADIRTELAQTLDRLDAEDIRRMAVEYLEEE